MLKTLSSLGTAALLVFAAWGATAAPMHKCVVNGTITYQQSACAPEQARPRPSIEKLNAEHKQRRAAAAANAPAASAPTAGATGVPARSAGVPVLAPKAFRCDGRQHCSQMTSCEEARYFLANCPNVKMDGDRDGEPCEEQWCGR